jgi:hypothetical protein
MAKLGMAIAAVHYEKGDEGPNPLDIGPINY